jgi:hypothetical protein
VIKPKWNGPGDVVGCGVLVVKPENELAIFFTLNGTLLGQFMTELGVGVSWVLAKFFNLNSRQV